MQMWPGKAIEPFQIICGRNLLFYLTILLFPKLRALANTLSFIIVKKYNKNLEKNKQRSNLSILCRKTRYKPLTRMTLPSAIHTFQRRGFTVYLQPK